MFEVYSESSALQFSASTHAYSFVGKGSITCIDYRSPYGYIGTYGYVDVPYAFDIVAFRCSQAFFVPKNKRYNGEPSNRIRVFTQKCKRMSSYDAAYDFTGLNSHTVEYWCFQSMRRLQPTVSGLGLQIFNADGSLCYDSNLRPIIIINNYRLIGIPGPTSPSTVSIPSSNYACIGYGNSTAALSDGQYTFQMEGLIKNQNYSYQCCYLASQMLDSISTGVVEPKSGGGILSIDVSNY